MAENLFGYIDTRGESEIIYNATPLSTAPAFDTTTAYNVGDYCFYNGTLYRFTAAKSAGAWDASCVESAVIAEDVKSVQSSLASKATAITETTSGSIVTIDDGADGIPVESLTISIEPVQEGSGDPSPENVRPISGFDSVHVYHSGADTSDPDVLTVSLASAGTVYGGTLDVTNGVLTVDRKKLILQPNMGWSKSSSYPGGYLCAAGTLGLKDYTAFLCSHAKYAASLSEYVRGTCFCNRSLNFRLLGEDSTLQDWQDYLTNNEVSIVGELVTPLTYQLTPAELTTLLGKNHIWADSGDVDVTYRADTNMFLESRKAESESYCDDMVTSSQETAMSATHNYTAGTLIIANGTLLRATANIANGGAIIIGMNAETVDLETLIAEKADQVFVAKLPFISSATLYNNVADFHNAIPRGKDITSYFTDGSLWNRINGTNGYSLFEDLYVGDYIIAGGQSYTIVDFDYYIRCGEGVDITQHHLVMMPTGSMNIPEGTALYKTDPDAEQEYLTLINTANAGVTVSSQETAAYKKWNATMEAPNANSTAGGYKYSRMRQVVMKAADTIVVNAFGVSHVKPIPVIYPSPANAEASGLASAWVWFKDDDWSSDTRRSICDLPNEVQIYGTQAFGLGSGWDKSGYEIGVDKFQFSLFRADRSWVNLRAGWWLRSVFSATNAALVTATGIAATGGASDAGGVRPRFLIFGS